MENAVSSNGQDDGGGGGGGGGGSRPSRLPRWTRQEILVLMQGKRVAERRGRGRAGSRLHHMGAAVAAGPVETKWASVSSYCRRHGVNRGAVQCRKRWSNLAGDYKKIKEWESRRRLEGGGGGGGESFWVMRSDMKKERRLPGFFDKEVYDILDGKVEVRVDEEEEKVMVTEEESGIDGKREEAEGEEEVAVAVFGSGKGEGDDGLFSDSETEEGEKVEKREEERTPVDSAAAVTPISEKSMEPFHHASSSDQGTTNAKQPDDNNPEKWTTSTDRNKRKRTSPDEAGEMSLQDRLVGVLERSSRMLTAQLEAQNIYSQLDRDQRKEQTNTMIEVLHKLASALAKIADKF